MALTSYTVGFIFGVITGIQINRIWKNYCYLIFPHKWEKIYRDPGTIREELVAKQCKHCFKYVQLKGDNYVQ